MGYKVYINQYLKLFKKQYFYLYGPYILLMLMIAVLYTGEPDFWYEGELYLFLMAAVSFIIPGIITNMTWSKVDYKTYYILDQKSVKPIVVNILFPIIVNALVLLLIILSFYITMSNTFDFINEFFLSKLYIFIILSLPFVFTVTASKLTKMKNANKVTLYLLGVYLMIVTIFLISIQNVTHSDVYTKMLDGLAIVSLLYVFVTMPLIVIIYSYKYGEV